jgi:hypothetical protein
MLDYRSLAQIKSDIESAGKVTRQDVYEILQNFSGKTKEEKINDIRSFVETLPDAIKNKKGSNSKNLADSIIDDMDSYLII